MQGLAASEPPPAGWSPDALTRFLSEGRDWGAVTTFHRRLVAGEAQLGDLGLELLEPPSPPLPLPPPVVPASPSPDASVQPDAEPLAQQTAATAGSNEQLDRPATALGAQPQQRQRQQQRQAGGPRSRTTWRLHASYFGPAFRQASQGRCCG